MFTNQKLRLYIFAFLAFCVLSSKHIFIYNEETLVAISFFAFIFFVFHYFGDTIKDSLNERSDLIQQELQNFLNLKQSSFNELLIEHNRVSGLVKIMKLLENFTNNELKFLNLNSKNALNNMFINQMQQKLKTLAFSKLMLQQKLQYLLSENILSNVLLAFQQAKSDKVGLDTTKISPKTIQNAIRLLNQSN